MTVPDFVGDIKWSPAPTAGHKVQRSGPATFGWVFLRYAERRISS
ncbi:hypothetical protein [Mycobacteroides abscessus]|nr:hypothetical protein [Mycobacteroides abscessus]